MVLSCCAEGGESSPPGILGRGGRPAGTSLFVLVEILGVTKMRGQLLAHSILFLGMDQKTLRGNSYFVNNYIVNFFQEKMKRRSYVIEIFESLYYAHCNLVVQTFELLFLQKL